MKRASLFLALAALAVSSQAHAEVLIGATGGQGHPSTLYRIDPATAVATRIDHAVNGRFSLTGLAADPATGALYGVTCGAATDAGPGKHLVRIGLATNVFEDVGPLMSEAGTIQASDLAFDGSGRLFVWDQSNYWLAAVDKATAVVTPLQEEGRESTSGAGLRFGPGGGLFLAANGDAPSVDHPEGGFLHVLDTDGGHDWGSGQFVGDVRADGGGLPIGALAATTDGTLFGTRMNRGDPRDPGAADLLRLEARSLARSVGLDAGIDDAGDAATEPSTDVPVTRIGTFREGSNGPPLLMAALTFVNDGLVPPPVVTDGGDDASTDGGGSSTGGTTGGSSGGTSGGATGGTTGGVVPPPGPPRRPDRSCTCELAGYAADGSALPVVFASALALLAVRRRRRS